MNWLVLMAALSVPAVSAAPTIKKSTCPVAVAISTASPELLSIEEFGSLVKQKFPEYVEIESEEIGLRTLKKHPACRRFVDAWKSLDSKSTRPPEEPKSRRVEEEQVSFNTRSLKHHCSYCRSAVKCTKNCISVSLSEARRRGGIPCRVCGGSCR